MSVKRNPNPVTFPKGYPHCIIIICKGKDYYLYSEAPADRFLYGFSCLYNKKTQKPLSGQFFLKIFFFYLKKKKKKKRGTSCFPSKDEQNLGSRWKYLQKPARQSVSSLIKRPQRKLNVKRRQSNE